MSELLSARLPNQGVGPHDPPPPSGFSWKRWSFGVLIFLSPFAFDKAWEWSDLKPNIFITCMAWCVPLVWLLWMFWIVPWTRRIPGWVKVTVSILMPLVLVFTFRTWIIEKYQSQYPIEVQSVKTLIRGHYKIMPFNSPYPPDTVIAGIRFEPHMLDVRFFVNIKHAPVKNLDLRIRLINTSGDMLSIKAVAQRTTFPHMTIIPMMPMPNPGAESITIRKGGEDLTVPMGGSTPSGSLVMYTDTWRIHCTELFEDTLAEFVLMVTKPGDDKMIEGFILQGSYEYALDDETKAEKFSLMTLFDSSGTPRIPSKSEIEAILKYRKPTVEIRDYTIGDTYPLLPRSFPPGSKTNSTNTPPP